MRYSRHLADQQGECVLFNSPLSLSPHVLEISRTFSDKSHLGASPNQNREGWFLALTRIRARSHDWMSSESYDDGSLEESQWARMGKIMSSLHMDCQALFLQKKAQAVHGWLENRFCSLLYWPEHSLHAKQHQKQLTSWAFQGPSQCMGPSGIQQEQERKVFLDTYWAAWLLQMSESLVFTVSNSKTLSFLSVWAQLPWSKATSQRWNAWPQRMYGF